MMIFNAICLVLGLILGHLTNSMQLLLSSKMVQCTLACSIMIGSTTANSPISAIRGIVSLIACDRAIYSASVVLNDISD